MSHALRTAIIALALVPPLALVACNRGDKTASNNDTKATVTSTAAVPKVQTNKAPCDWISRADAEKAFGEPLTADPVRVRSAENAVPQADGDGCLYQLKSTSAFSEGKVAIEVVADDAGAMQTGFSGVPDVEAVFKSKESHGDSVVDGRWDFESGLPGGIAMLRKGRIVIQVFAFGKADQGKALAGAVLDGIPDLPFTNDLADPHAKSQDPDPCSLITRAEAEAELGPLTMAPFRSRENSAIAHGNGASCSYYTGKHRAFVVTPTFERGAMRYKMMSGVGSMVSGVLGGAKSPDTLDGPWDQLSTNATGSLTLLKGDKMLEMQYKSSTADFAHAVKLARAAATKL
jgi:hypothetical protein